MRNSPTIVDSFAPYSETGELPLLTAENTELTAETWDNFDPRERRVVLTEMRRTNPSVALALITENAANTAADERLAVPIYVLDDVFQLQSHEVKTSFHHTSPSQSLGSVASVNRKPDS